MRYIVTLSFLLLCYCTSSVMGHNLDVKPIKLFPGSLAVGSSSTSRYSITNLGNKPLYQLKVLLPAFVSQDPKTDTCIGRTLAPHASCILGLKITNIKAGAQALPNKTPYYPQVSANAGQYVAYPELQEQRLNVQATTPIKGVVYSIDQGFFQNMGDNTPYQVEVTFTNTSETVLTGINVALSSAPNFVLKRTTCNGDLAVGGQCHVEATYTTPLDASGPLKETVTFSSERTGKVVVSLTGNFVDVAVTGSSLTPLPPYITPQNNYFLFYQFKNNTPGVASEVSVIPPEAPGLKIVTNSCSHINSLAFNQYCQIKERYTAPTSGTVQFNQNPQLSYQQGVPVTLPNNSTVITNAGVKCWGRNRFGQLGNGSTTNSSTPVDVHTSASEPKPLKSSVALTNGWYHACALLQNGEVKCWGYNGNGQLGNGSTTDSHTPVLVRASATGTKPLTNVVSIAAGSQHTCALLRNGQAECWGRNNNGQLGNGTTTNSSTPVFVRTSATESAPLSNIVAMVGGGAYHTCALLRDGQVKCWGYNGRGQLGNGTKTDSSTPVDVHTSTTESKPLTNVVAVTGGSYFTCALLQNGAVKCWGAGTDGQLGDGTTIDHSTPVSVLTSATDPTPLVNVVQLSGGSYYTCALLNNGQVKCWGWNKYGQLGDATLQDRHNPVWVHTSLTDATPLTNVMSITAKEYHTCALLQSGTMKCWGLNDYDQLGNGSTTNSSTPVDVHTSATEQNPLTNVVAAAAGSTFSCALINPKS